MASSLIPARRRLVAALAAAGGLALVPLPAVAAPAPAAPSTSVEAAQLVAVRAHQLEVVSEQVNTAREQLTLQQDAAAQASRQLDADRAAVTSARDQVRAMARSAFTGNRLTALQAMLTSGSVTQALDRLAMLQTVSAHNNAVLDAAKRATAQAAQDQARATQAAAAAQATFTQLNAQQHDLDVQVADYQAQYDRLSAQEQAAARAAAEHAVQAAAPQPSSRHTAPAAPPPAPAVTAAAAPAPVVAASGAAQTAVNTALAQVGKPYVWGAAGPNSFDCSGLMQYAWAAAGVSLPHSSSMQSTMGTPVSQSQLQPGDLVFFYSPVSHVAMYIGNGQIVHAATSGEPVKVVPLSSMPSYNSARRLTG